MNPMDAVGSCMMQEVRLIDLNPEVQRKLKHFDEVVAAMRRFDEFCEEGRMKKLMMTNSRVLRDEYADIRSDMMMALYRYDNDQGEST